MRLTDRVYLVGSGSTGFGLTHPADCHVYLLDGGQEVALVDAGVGLDQAEILHNVRRDGFDPQRIWHLLLTHAHADHAGGTAGLREALPDLHVYAAPEAARYVREGDEQAINLHLAKEVGLFPGDYVFHPAPVEEELHEGEAVPVGDLELQVIETPGHCSGHLCFLMDHAGPRHLFAGDAIFYGGKILMQRIWDCDLQAYLQSIKKLDALGVDALLPGHLNLSLKDGQRHIDAAVRIIDQLLVPENMVYGW